MTKTTTSAAPVGGFSTGYVNYVLTLIFVVSAINVCDRTIVAVLVDDIRADLALDDRQMGVVMGLAFSVTYLLASVPIARLADRRARAPIVASALFTWSLMTAASGMAQSYLQLLLARMGVGLGEAGGSPPCHSLLMDYVPPERRARAMSWLPIGALIGVGVGMYYGGWASGQFGWRLALVSVGIPGCVLALVFLFTVKEPPRRPSETRAAALETGSLREVILGLFRSAAFRWLVLASSVAMTAGLARTFWEPTFLRRVHGLDPAMAGAVYLLISTLPSAIGTWLGALLADRLGTRDRRWYAWVPAIGSVAMVPFAVSFYLLPATSHVAGIPAGFLLAAIASLLSGAWSAPVMATAQTLAPPEARAVAAAVWTTVATFVGGSLGPLLVGDLNLRLESIAGAGSVRWSLAALALLPLLAAVAFQRLARYIPRSAAAASEVESRPFA